jgi:hypothetical protein
LQRALLLLAALVAVVGLAKALTPTLEAGVAWLGAAMTPKTVRWLRHARSPAPPMS